jgi:tetratricopeptide (TPR) repeat protein
MTCPSADAIVQFVAGELDESARQQMELHIDACRDCASLVQEANAGLGQTTRRYGEDAPPSPPPGELSRGASVSRYIILSLLGEGGLGRVYLAYDPELDRKVAIKLMRDGAAASDEVAARLLREGRAMARLAHPNVVVVHDIGMSALGPFIAMDVVEGGTLRQWLAATPRSWQQIRDMFVAAGRGLEAAHAVGLVHRDFKPTNVLVGLRDQVLVTDFGLARAFGDGRDGSPVDDGLRLPWSDVALTRTGTVMGTPAYIAPEQLRGRAVDARADQFSFCVSLYEALFGVRPFAAEDLVEYLRAITKGEPQPARARREVPAALRKALLRGLADDPTKRYGDMGELLRALTWDRRARRRHLALGLAAVALTGAGVGVGFALQPELPADPTEIDGLVDEARLAAAQARFVYPERARPDEPTAYQRVLQLEALEHEDALADDAAATLRQEFSTTLVRLGDEYWSREGGAPFAADYYIAAVMFDPANAHAAARMMVTPGELASLRAKASASDYSIEELAAAEPSRILADPEPTRRAQRIGELAAKGGTSLTLLERLRRVAGIDAVEPTIATAAPPKPRAPTPVVPEPAAESKNGVEPTPAIEPAPAAPPDDASATRELALGRAAIRSNDLDVAEQHFHRALKVRRNDAEACAGLSEVYFERGEFSRAVEFGRRAVTHRPKVARYWIALGDAHLRTLEYDDATRAYERARELGDGRAAGRLSALASRLGR